ncbi:MAG: GH3 auxin-responsive promoter family protein [Eubacterium sp.]|nr:GH3 auxin-responsive promoter family protein [Eubacterium sp.]
MSIYKSEKSRNVSNTVMNKVFNKVVVERGKKAVHSLDVASKNAVKLQQECLMKLIEDNKDTEYGKMYDFANIHSIEDYQKKVPLTDYDDYAPYIKKMVEDGENNLITASEPKHYAISSGSIGVPKHIPVTQAEIDKYSKYGPGMAFGVMDEYYRNTTGHSFKYGLGANMVELKSQVTPSGVSMGSISGNVLNSLKSFIKFFFQPPWEVICPDDDIDVKYLRARFILQTRNITYIDGAFMTALVDFMDYIKDNWEMLCKDIYHGRINSKIAIPEKSRELFELMIEPNQGRARELVREFRKGMEGIVPRIWPNIQFVASIGTGGFFTYSTKMKYYTGRNVPFYNMLYGASEGLVAVARHAEDKSYVLIPDGGFYEFIPVKDDEEDKILTIDKLEEGESYEIIFTNLSGLYRYRIKDVVRVTGFYNESPKIQFVYRKSQMISIAGEKTNDEALRWVIKQFIKDTGVEVSDYSIYADTDSEPGRYVFLIEPNEVVPQERIPELRDTIEARMMQANPSYGDKIRNGVLSPARLVILQQQTYMLYRDLMIMKGTSANQLKPVRVIDTPMKEAFFFSLEEKYN